MPRPPGKSFFEMTDKKLRRIASGEAAFASKTSRVKAQQELDIRREEKRLQQSLPRPKALTKNPIGARYPPRRKKPKKIVGKTISPRYEE